MKKLPPYYMITDRKQTDNLLKSVKKALKNGVRLIQLREKDLRTYDQYSLAKNLKKICDKKKARLLIHSRSDIALALNLDGVHLPQAGHCLSLPDTRLLLGKNKLIGQSCHSLKEAIRAEKEGADFITFGPVFKTPSKLKYGAPLGLKKLEQVCRKVRIPVYALGGLKRNDLEQVQKHGARGLAGIRAFY